MFFDDMITKENLLAKAMLVEATRNEHIKNMLSNISDQLIITILNPLRQALENMQDISSLPSHIQASYIYLAEEHGLEKKRWLAIHPQLPFKEILNSKKQIQKLLDETKNRLSTIKNAKDIEDIAKATKAITDLGYCYVEYFPNTLKSQHYHLIDTFIRPTPEELDVRIHHTEMGQKEKSTNMFGIRREDTDNENMEGRRVGKYFYTAVSMKKRLKIIIKEFDSIQEKLNEHLKIIQAGQVVAGKMLQEQQVLQGKRDKLAQKMNYYKIPLDPKARKNINHYATRFETSLEKQASIFKTAPLPIVAGISGTMARALVMLQDLETFQNENNEFDFMKAQIICNCLTAGLIHGGHHSLIECAEIYNRLLDFIAIKNLQENKKNIADAESADSQSIPYIELTNSVERTWPYYVIGNPLSFIFSGYRENVRDIMVQEKATLLQQNKNPANDDNLITSTQPTSTHRLKK